MPRVATALLKRCRSIDPLLAHLLPTCRSLDSAKNELRWFEDYVKQKDSSAYIQSSKSIHSQTQWRRAYLRRLCLARKRGTPLQYLLGTEYFGDLELLCEPGVLIPRQDTAYLVSHLASKLKLDRGYAVLGRPLRVLDLCSGSGCMSLLLAHELRQANQSIEVLGVDVSRKAVSLAKQNFSRLERSLQPSSLEYECADLLAAGGSGKNDAPSIDDLLTSPGRDQYDIVISNPPYISEQGYFATTARSVRGFEPKLALVPEAGRGSRGSVVPAQDIFYPRILELAQRAGARAVLLEVADLDQALRVASYAADKTMPWEALEIWRDEVGSPQDVIEMHKSKCLSIPIIGPKRHHGRGVFLWKD